MSEFSQESFICFAHIRTPLVWIFLVWTIFPCICYMCLTCVSACRCVIFFFRSWQPTMLLFVFSKLYSCVCVCPSQAIPRKLLKVIIIKVIKLGTVTTSDMRMHHMLIILTLTLNQGHTDLIEYFRKFSSNVKQVCCEDSLTKCLHNLFSVWWPWPSLKLIPASQS